MQDDVLPATMPRKTSTLSIRLTPAERDALRRLARAEDRPIGQLVRRAIRQSLALP